MSKGRALRPQLPPDALSDRLVRRARLQLHEPIRQELGLSGGWCGAPPPHCVKRAGFRMTGTRYLRPPGYYPTSKTRNPGLPSGATSRHPTVHTRLLRLHVHSASSGALKPNIPMALPGPANGVPNASEESRT